MRSFADKPAASRSTAAAGTGRARSNLQPKLAIGSVGDSYEREADRISEQVTRASEPTIHRTCACGGSCPRCQDTRAVQHARVQVKHAEGSDTGQVAAPPIVDEVLTTPGQPLDPDSRALMESRLGADFGHVRVHTDEAAAHSAHAVNALAFTVGNHVAFGAGQYWPTTPAGQKLLSHELVHVMQQAGNGQSNHLQRQLTMQPTDVPASTVLRDAPNAKSWSGAASKCGPDFCHPLPSVGMALDSQKSMWPIYMAGIAYAVSSRVVPLWSKWAFGGSSSVLNLTADFGGDFHTSLTTARTTTFLINAIRTKLAASPPTIPAAGLVTLDIPALIPNEVKAIDDPNNKTDQMNFNAIGEIPGNIAGGIGKDQAANPVGANPSPQDDARIAKGTVTVFNAGSSLLVNPQLSYTVRDTIDLCPGDCGAKREQIATIPMSQWEATGISGDVPFFVDFPAPLLLTLPFTIPKPGVPAAKGP